jgi:hypothetical protein
LTPAATAPAPLQPALSNPLLQPSGSLAPPAVAPAAAPRATPRYEPIEADEVAAFKRALASAAGAASAAPAGAKPGVAVRSGPLLPPSAPTGFEDTEMPGAERGQDLSSTQYGELN